MSDNPQFWTKVGVERHMLPSGVAEYSTTQAYAVGSWVWSSVAATPGLYVCKMAIAYTPGGAPNPWDATKWSSMQDVSSLFSDNNPAMAAKQPKIMSDGILKGNGSGGISVAEPGTDYLTTHQDVSGKANKSDFSLTSQGVPSESYVSALFSSANTSTRYEMADVANDTLKVQTFNRLAVSDATAHDFEFPDASTGRSRDFALRIEIAAGSYTPSVTFPSATYEGDDFPDIAPDASNAKAFLICFTETKNLTWLVKAMELKTPTTPPPVATV